MEETNKKRIVVLGTGFGGIYTYLNLHRQLHRRDDVEIILISKTDHFLFVPLVHEVATGNLLPSSIRQSVRTVPQCCISDFIPGKVTGIDLDNKTVTFSNTYLREDTDDRLERGITSFDYLVIALGSQTAYFGVPGAEQFGIPLKDLDDAKKIKNTILRRFEEAQLEQDEDKKRKILNFTIVGGGPTGVELAGEVLDLLNKELHEAYPKVSQYAQVTLIEGNEVLVKQLGRWFGAEVKTILEKKGKIKILLNTRVKEVRKNGVSIGDEFIKSDTVIWTAGVKAAELQINSKRPVERQEHTERIRVTQNLNLEKYQDVFVVGDQAWVCDQENGQPYPMRAQFAVREGSVAARNIVRRMRGEKLKEFDWQDKGIIVSLGKGGALAHIFNMRLSGPLAWGIYRGAYLSKMLGVRAKIRTAIEWTLNIFNPRDISEL